MWLCVCGIFGHRYASVVVQSPRFKDTLLYKSTDRMEEGRRSMGLQYNPSSGELCAAVRQCSKDKFNLVGGFIPFNG